MSGPITAATEFLKCDAPDCDHFEMTPITVDVVDMPCPKCGANLCTKDDFILFSSIRAASDAARQVLLRDQPDAQLHLVATNVHNGVLRQTDGPIAGKNPFPNKPELSR
jgi:hypothetical protein